MPSVGSCRLLGPAGAWWCGKVCCEIGLGLATLEARASGCRHDQRQLRQPAFPGDALRGALWSNATDAGHAGDGAGGSAHPRTPGQARPAALLSASAPRRSVRNLTTLIATLLRSTTRIALLLVGILVVFFVLFSTLFIKVV